MTGPEISRVAAGLAGALALGTTSVATAQVAERAKAYKQFLDGGRTARLAIGVARRWATQRGFRAVDLDASSSCRGFKPGDRLLFVWHDRTGLFVRVGRQPVARGMVLIGAHVDAPALRLAAKPITRNKQDWAVLLAYPYGGIKQEHYHHRALRIVGTVVRRDGTSVDVSLGPRDGFSFMLSPDTELPPRPRPKPKPGERPKHEPPKLKLIAASRPGAAVPARKQLVALLRKRYRLTPRDLRSAELYAVAAAPARDVGLGRSMVGGFGQDDRSLSFAALRAMLELRATPPHTAAALLVDREETGSRGRTGAQAPILEHAIACLARSEGARGGRVDATVRRGLARSIALSTDVKSAINPNWPEVQDHKNAPTMGRGPTLVKFTGHHGKRGASDANPRLSRWVRTIAARARLPLQRSETGRVDEGGGGTIAKFLARRGIDVIDVGVPLLSMHAPFEVVDKRDLSWCVDLFAAFLRAGLPPTR